MLSKLLNLIFPKRRTDSPGHYDRSERTRRYDVTYKLSSNLTAMIFLLIVIAALLFFILLFLLSIDDRLLEIETYTRLLKDYRSELNSLLEKLHKPTK